MKPFSLNPTRKKLLTSHYQTRPTLYIFLLINNNAEKSKIGKNPSVPQEYPCKQLQNNVFL